jgi:DTW domain-containing protein YfiP
VGTETERRKPKPKENQKENQEEGYTFVAIDGTWKNARNMLKRLPRDKVTLVSLPPEAFIGESVGGIHTKARPCRCSLR